MNKKNGWSLRTVASATVSLACGAVGLSLASDTGPARWFTDVLDTAAVPSHRVPKLETVGVARAGSAWVVVGARGVILRSEDEGASWQQVPSPVSSDLTSVYFLDARSGWAVGHDAVILHTADGGLSWERQLDGRSAAQLLQASYARLAGEGDAYAKTAQQDLERTFAASGGQPIVSTPLLDIWFANATEGYAVGAFNLLFHTLDGGKTWSPADHLTENPKAFHLNAVRGGPAGLFIVGEQGLVLRWEAVARRFVPAPTDYAGSFLGVLNTADKLIVYGLRGNARVSDNGGKTWSAVRIDTVSSIVKVMAAGPHLLYLLQDGSVYRQDPHGELQRVLMPPVRSGEVYGAELADGQRLLSAGLSGPMLTSVPELPQ